MVSKPKLTFNERTKICLLTIHSQNSKLDISMFTPLHSPVKILKCILNYSLQFNFLRICEDHNFSEAVFRRSRRAGWRSGGVQRAATDRRQPATTGRLNICRRCLVAARNRTLHQKLGFYNFVTATLTAKRKKYSFGMSQTNILYFLRLHPRDKTFYVYK